MNQILRPAKINIRVNIKGLISATPNNNDKTEQVHTIYDQGNDIHLIQVQMELQGKDVVVLYSEISFVKKANVKR